MIMPDHFLKSIKLVSRFFKAMLPKRCRKREDESNVVHAPHENIDEGQLQPGSRHLTSPCSPKKRREVRFIDEIVVNEPDSNVAIIMPPFQHALDPPIIERDHVIQTPPAIELNDHSPPQLLQRDHTIGTQNCGVSPLPLLPSDLINDIGGPMAQKFRLNPRLHWNPEMISKQLRYEERTQSLLCNEDEPPNNCNNDFSGNVGINCTGDVVKPVPKYGSGMIVAASATTADCDNTTLLNTATGTTLTNTVADTTFVSTISEGPCCGLFNSSLTSAFEAINRPKQEKEK